MAAQLITLPFRPVINTRGVLEPGALLDVFHAGTTTRVSVYADGDLSVELTNPVVADSSGVFPTVYFDNALPVRVRVRQANGTVIGDADPYYSDGLSSTDLSFTQSGAGAVTRTVQAKLREAVSVKDFGAVGDGVTDDTAAISLAIAAVNAAAAANGRFTLVFPDGDYIVDTNEATYQTTADWRILFAVGDNVTIKGPGRIISTTPFARRCVIFAVRGDNVVFDGLRGEDTVVQPTGNSFAVFIGWGNEYDDGLSAKTYANLTVRNCEMDNHWLSVSCQTNTGTTSLISGVRLVGNRASRADSVTSAGCYNFRAEDPGDISDVEIFGNVGENGPTAAVFNFFGVHGVNGSGNTQLGSTTYAGCEFENGCKDVSWAGFRSEETVIGVWIDQSEDIEIVAPQMLGDLYITAETNEVANVHLTGGFIGGVNVPTFGTYVDGVIKNVFVDGPLIKGTGTHAVFIDGERLNTTGSVYLRNVDVSPDATFTNSLSVVRNAAMGLVQVEGGNLDRANINTSGSGGIINIAGTCLGGGTARNSIAAAANANFVFNLPVTPTTSVRGGRLFFASRDASSGGGAVFEALFSISREAGAASVTIGGVINGIGDVDARNVTLSASVITDGTTLTVNVTNASAKLLQIRAFCEVTKGTSAA